jgi:quercetin dioxygenase-like cupin family protein
MKKVELKDVKPYDAKGHFNMAALRLQAKAETDCQNYWVGMSHFLPGGGAEMGVVPAEMVYFVLEGELTVYDDKNNKIVLKKWDSLHIAPGEKRSLINETSLPATQLVIGTYPPAK